MEKKIIAVTGHRPSKLGGYSFINQLKLVSFATIQLDQLEPYKVITGMAQGWDQAVANACFIMKVPYIAAVPFKGQERMWPEASQKVYNWLLENASEVVIVSGGAYKPWKMQVRNEWMVDNSKLVLSLWDGTPGGTANCVRYTKSKGKPLVNVWDEWVAYAKENSL